MKNIIYLSISVFSIIYLFSSFSYSGNIVYDVQGTAFIDKDFKLPLMQVRVIAFKEKPSDKAIPEYYNDLTDIRKTNDIGVFKVPLSFEVKDETQEVETDFFKSILNWLSSFSHKEKESVSFHLLFLDDDYKVYYREEFPGTPDDNNIIKIDSIWVGESTPIPNSKVFANEKEKNK